MPYLSAYDDPDILAANGGTIAREILRDRPDVGTVVVPVGGAGLSGGLSWELRESGSAARVIAAIRSMSSGVAGSLLAPRFPMTYRRSGACGTCVPMSSVREPSGKADWLSK